MIAWLRYSFCDALFLSRVYAMRCLRALAAALRGQLSLRQLSMQCTHTCPQLVHPLCCTAAPGAPALYLPEQSTSCALTTAHSQCTTTAHSQCTTTAHSQCTTTAHSQCTADRARSVSQLLCQVPSCCTDRAPSYLNRSISLNPTHHHSPLVWQVLDHWSAACETAATVERLQVRSTLLLRSCVLCACVARMCVYCAVLVPRAVWMHRAVCMRQPCAVCVRQPCAVCVHRAVWVPHLCAVWVQRMRFYEEMVLADSFNDFELLSCWAKRGVPPELRSRVPLQCCCSSAGW